MSYGNPGLNLYKTLPSLIYANQGKGGLFPAIYVINLDGYVKSWNHGDPVAVFVKIRISGPKANEVTMVMCLCRLLLLTCMQNAGLLRRLSLCFVWVSMGKSDVLIWNATRGLVKKSLDLYSEMKIVGIKPE
jgi:hypothetical protein